MVRINNPSLFFVCVSVVCTGLLLAYFRIYGGSGADAVAAGLIFCVLPAGYSASRVCRGSGITNWSGDFAFATMGLSLLASGILLPGIAVWRQQSLYNASLIRWFNTGRHIFVRYYAPGEMNRWRVIVRPYVRDSAEMVQSMRGRMASFALVASASQPLRSRRGDSKTAAREGQLVLVSRSVRTPGGGGWRFLVFSDGSEFVIRSSDWDTLRYALHLQGGNARPPLLLAHPWAAAWHEAGLIRNGVLHR